MEEERKIEKWLRAYAKKRRAQAGESFRIHPATRRLLQGEISRNTPPRDGDDESESLSLWEVLRRQWVFLLSFAVCVFLAAVIFFLSVDRHGQEYAGRSNLAQMAAKENNGQSADRKKTSQATNFSSSTMVAVNSSAAAPTIIPQTGISGAPAVVPPPVETAPPAVVPIPPGAALSEGNQAAAPPQLTAAAPEIPATAQPMSPPPAAADTTATFALNDEKVQGFVNAPAARRALPEQSQTAVFKNGVAQALPVLANFQVQQNGNAIRIIDQDGSVYDGSLQSFASTPPRQQAPRQYGAVQNAVGVAGGIPSPPIGQAQNAIHAIQNYFFRVNGTNRTLHQSVSCSGYLIANSPPATNTLQTWGTVSGNIGGFGGGGGVASDQLQLKTRTTNGLAQLPWLNFRISGAAIVNHTNHIEINATPVK